METPEWARGLRLREAHPGHAVDRDKGKAAVADHLWLRRAWFHHDSQLVPPAEAVCERPPRIDGRAWRANRSRVPSRRVSRRQRQYGGESTESTTSRVTNAFGG